MARHVAPRGLTLIEVLASVALLTLLATAAVPVLRSAQIQQPEPKSIDLVDLSRLADVADLSALVSTDAAGAESTVISIAWDELGDDPDDDIAGRPPVTAHTAVVGEFGAWIAFSCDGLQVFRWIEQREGQ